MTAAMTMDRDRPERKHSRVREASKELGAALLQSDLAARGKRYLEGVKKYGRKEGERIANDRGAQLLWKGLQRYSKFKLPTKMAIAAGMGFSITLLSAPITAALVVGAIAAARSGTGSLLSKKTALKVKEWMANPSLQNLTDKWPAMKEILPILAAGGAGIAIALAFGVTQAAAQGLTVPEDKIAPEYRDASEKAYNEAIEVLGKKSAGAAAEPSTGAAPAETAIPRTGTAPEVSPRMTPEEITNKLKELKGSGVPLGDETRVLDERAAASAAAAKLPDAPPTGVVGEEALPKEPPPTRPPAGEVREVPPTDEVRDAPQTGTSYDIEGEAEARARLAQVEKIEKAGRLSELEAERAAADMAERPSSAKAPETPTRYNVEGEAEALEFQRQKTGAAWNEFERAEEQRAAAERTAAMELEKQRTGARWTELEQQELAREAAERAAAAEQHGVLEGDKRVRTQWEELGRKDEALTASQNEAAVRAYELQTQQETARVRLATAEAFDKHGVYGGFKQEVLNPDSSIGQTAKELGINLKGQSGEALNDALHRTLHKNPEFMKYFNTEDHKATIKPWRGGFRSDVDIDVSNPESGAKVQGMYKELFADKKFMGEFEKMLQKGPYKTLRASLGSPGDITNFIRTLGEHAAP